MYFAFIRHRKIFYTLSAILVILAVVSMIAFGLKTGIDFTGGSSLEISYQEEAVSPDQVRKSLEDLDLGEVSVQRIGQKGIVLKMKDISEEVHQQILDKLEELGEIEEGSENFQTIGSIIGEELKQKTNLVVFLSLIAILIYIALSFRRISRPVKSYVYGISGVIALCHDIIIPLGLLAVLGKFKGVEINIPIITAFLTIFGYSINDSIVVFDRIRENLLKTRALDFDGVVEQSINQTIARSINTTLTTLLALFAVFFFGGETLKYFALILLIGIFLGAYSSIFVATPLVVSYYKLRERKYQRK